ncbi:hypothetical protein LguiB_033495 [Lonicera macranthoides]
MDPHQYHTSSLLIRLNGIDKINLISRELNKSVSKAPSQQPLSSVLRKLTERSSRPTSTEEDTYDWFGSGRQGFLKTRIEVPSPTRIQALLQIRPCAANTLLHIKLRLEPSFDSMKEQSGKYLALYTRAISE